MLPEFLRQIPFHARGGKRPLFAFPFLYDAFQMICKDDDFLYLFGREVILKLVIADFLGSRCLKDQGMNEENSHERNQSIADLEFLYLPKTPQTSHNIAPCQMPAGGVLVIFSLKDGIYE